MLGRWRFLRGNRQRFDSGGGRDDMKPRWQHGRMYTARRMRTGLGKPGLIFLRGAHDRDHADRRSVFANRTLILRIKFRHLTFSPTIGGLTSISVPLIAPRPSPPSAPRGALDLRRRHRAPLRAAPAPAGRARARSAHRLSRFKPFTRWYWCLWVPKSGGIDAFKLRNYGQSRSPVARVYIRRSRGLR
jgi:hypothetical protein